MWSIQEELGCENPNTQHSLRRGAPTQCLIPRATRRRSSSPTPTVRPPRAVRTSISGQTLTRVPPVPRTELVPGPTLSILPEQSFPEHRLRFPIPPLIHGPTLGENIGKPTWSEPLMELRSPFKHPRPSLSSLSHRSAKHSSLVFFSKVLFYFSAAFGRGSGVKSSSFYPTGQCKQKHLKPQEKKKLCPHVSTRHLW